MNSKGTITSLIKQLYKLLRGVRAKALFALLLIVFLGVTEGASLLLIIPLLGIAGVNSIQASKSKPAAFIESIFESAGISLSVTNVLIIYVIIMSIYALLRYLQTINTASINQQIVVYWRNKVFHRLSYASWRSIQSIKSSDIQNTLTTEIRRFGAISNQLIQLSGTFILIASYLFVSSLLSIELTALALLPILIMVLLNRPANKKSFAIGKSSVNFNQQLQSVILEHLTALKLVKSYGKEEQHLNEFEETNQQVENKMMAFVRTTQKTKTFFEILAAIIIAIYIYAAIVVFETAVTELLLLIFIFARLLPKTTRLISNYQQILNHLPAAESTSQLLQQLKEEPESEARNKTQTLTRNIQFKNVHFSYGSNTVINDANFSISAKQTTVIRGGSGVGKTTTIDLIMGLQKVTKGTILIDDVAVDSLNASAWKAGIAYVPQDAFLFHKSIRQNLAWVNATAKDVDLWRALEAAGAKGFVEQLPNGLETIVGDRGTQISGGERQRIALARALLRQPHLLILDEATNAVDDKNEAIIKAALKNLNGNMTIIIVAHRSSLIELADQIIELK